QCTRSMRPVMPMIRSTASTSFSPAAQAWQVSRQKPMPLPPMWSHRRAMVSKCRAIAWSPPAVFSRYTATSVSRYSSALRQRSKPASQSLSSAWPPCTITAVALISEAASQVSCRILRDGMRTRLLADATLIRYGACTYNGMLDAFSTSASSRGLGFFQLCGLPRKNCTTSAPSAAASARGSSPWTCEPISTSVSLVRRPDTSRARLSVWATESRLRHEQEGQVGQVRTDHGTALDATDPAPRDEDGDAHQRDGPDHERAQASQEPRRVRQHHVECGLVSREMDANVPVTHVRREPHEKTPGRSPGFFVWTSGSRCSRNRPAAPRRRWPGRS